MTVIALILGFAVGFTVARLRYKPLLLANSAAIVAKDSEIKSLQAKDKMSTQKVAAETGTTYEMVNNQLVMDTGGSSSAVTKALVLPDGTKISVNGTIMKKDGSKITLTEGESFTLK